MYDDNNFFIFIICIFIIIGVSQTLLRSFDCLKMDGLCNLFIVLLYPILIYLVITSIKATKNSLHKTSRYLLNGLTLIVFILFLLLVNREYLLLLSIYFPGQLTNDLFCFFP